MSRMGERQVLEVRPVWIAYSKLAADASLRDFRFISIVGFVAILRATWKSALFSCVPEVNEALDATSGYPILNVIYYITGAYLATRTLGALLVVLPFFSTSITIASAS